MSLFWSITAYTNRYWLFWLRRWCCAEPRTSWWLAPSSLSMKDDDGLCRMEHSRRTTASPDLCFEEVETLLVWNGNSSNTDHFSLATWETNRKVSGRKSRWIDLLCEFPVKILYRKDQLTLWSTPYPDDKIADRSTFFLFWGIRIWLILFGSLTTKMTSFAI